MHQLTCILGRVGGDRLKKTLDLKIIHRNIAI